MLPLQGKRLELDVDELRARCRELKNRKAFPLRAVIICTPVNPTGKVFTANELAAIAAVCQEFDLLCIADEVYEHYVVSGQPHISIAALPGMWERTITVNSFSKSWNISGWRLGYVYGDARLVSPLNKPNNVFYVCSPTPLQRALSEVLMIDPRYYADVQERFLQSSGGSRFRRLNKWDSRFSTPAPHSTCGHGFPRDSKMPCSLIRC